MTQQQVNKVITEAMGLCYHEWGNAFQGWFYCMKCGNEKSSSVHPDFSTWQDWGRALEWAQGQEWWDRFISVEWDKGLMPDGDFLGTLLNPTCGSLALAEFIEANPQIFKED